MTRVLISRGRCEGKVANMLSDLEFMELANADDKDFRKPGLISICPTGHEDFSGLKVRAELPENSEPWRGSGKRRKPMCK